MLVEFASTESGVRIVRDYQLGGRWSDGSPSPDLTSIGMDVAGRLFMYMRDTLCSATVFVQYVYLRYVLYLFCTYDSLYSSTEDDNASVF